MNARALLCSLGVALTGCGGVSGQHDAGSADSGGFDAGQPDAGAWWEPSLRGCLSDAGSAPQTIGQVVERLNALPRPVSVACLVASLPRPLSLVATDSVFSAQPASGRRNPRLFLMSPQLIISVVVAGEGADLVEFGEVVAPGRTLKGELKLPVVEPLVPSAPYDRVLRSSPVTTCGLCHRLEEPHPTIDAGFVSAAFRPDPGSLLSHAELKQLLTGCDPALEPERCRMLVALLGLGTTFEGKFPSNFELFFQ